MRSFILLTMFAAGSLMADPVLSFSSTSSGNNLNQTVGWEFDVLTPITVTGLGWFDPQLAHTVGIWTATGTPTLKTSGVVEPGDPLVGQFQTVTVAPIVLTPGEYIVAGQNFCGPPGNGCTNTETLIFGTPFSTSSAISFIGGVYSTGTAFEFPTVAVAPPPNGDPNCCWGPSFSIDAVASVPEPANVGALLAIGILAAALRTRRRQRA